jgi:hypothetical protein
MSPMTASSCAANNLYTRQIIMVLAKHIPQRFNVVILNPTPQK